MCLVPCRVDGRTSLDSHVKFELLAISMQILIKHNQTSRPGCSTFEAHEQNSGRHLVMNDLLSTSPSHF